jgi:hypothetical protein
LALSPADSPPRSASPLGKFHRQIASRAGVMAENSAETAAIAGGRGRLAAEKPFIIRFFTMARALPLHWRERPGRRCGTLSEFVMMFALGAASSALDMIKSLASSNSSSSPATGFNEASTDPFNISSGAAASTGAPATGFTGGGSQISPATMSALLAAQGQSSAGTASSASTSPADALQNLFSQIDGNGDGQISKSEFESALGAGGTNIAQADDVFGKLDQDGNGSVSLGELSSALQGSQGSHGGGHHGHVSDSAASADSAGSGSSGASSDPLLQALAAASGTSVTNSDGSTTTSLSFADGSTVSMTVPAATTSSSAATSSYNLIEQLIKREQQAISFTPASLSVSA